MAKKMMSHADEIAALAKQVDSVEELAGIASKMPHGSEKAQLIEEILRRVDKSDQVTGSLADIERSADAIRQQLNQFSGPEKLRKSVDDLTSQLTDGIRSGNLKMDDVYDVIHHRGEAIRNVEVPGKPNLPAPHASQRVTIDGSRLNDRKYVQNTVGNHVTGMLGEEELLLRFHTQTDEVVLKWGHHVAENGNDIITYNPVTKRVGLWDSKVTRSKSKNGLKLKDSGTFTNEARRANAMDEAREAIRASGLSKSQKANALDALENGDVSMNTAASGNYRNSTLRDLE